MSTRTYDEALAEIAGALNLAIGLPNTGEYVDCILDHIRGALDREQQAWGRWQAFYGALTEIANQGNETARHALQQDRRP